MPNDLTDQLDSLARTFAADLIRAIRAARMSDVFAYGADAPAQVSPPKARTTKIRDSERGGSSRARSNDSGNEAAAMSALAKNVQRGPAPETLRDAQSIVEFVRKKPGVGGVEIRKSLGMAPPSWVRAIQHCRTGGLVRMVGRTKSARYWVGSGA